MAHIAIFTSGWPRGAIQRQMLNLAVEFRRAGHRVTLLGSRVSGPLPEDAPGFELVDLESRLARLPGIRRHKRYRVPLTLPALVGFLRRERPDALLAAGEYPNLVALAARALARVPTRVVVSERVHLSTSAHSGRRRRKWLLPHLVRLAYAHADGVTAVSAGVAADLAAVTGLARTRIVDIPNPTVTDALLARRDQPLDDPWYAPGAPPVVVNVAQLRPQKDQATLLRAFARVRAVRPARLLILGEGNQRPRLEALAHELGVAPDVRLAGYVSNPLPYVRRAAVFALSSAWEGLPNVLIEALACGCPVVSTDCPSGPAEILDGGRYGALVPVGDDAALAAALLGALDTVPDRAALEARGRTFSAPAAAAQYLRVLLGAP